MDGGGGLVDVEWCCYESVSKGGHQRPKVIIYP